MPLYEYVCQSDGQRLELLRPIADADKPVEDPERRGRTFTRIHSTFAAKSAGRPSASTLPIGAGCPCGKPHGCSSRSPG